jgi:indole-3-glycerol phosphate synthase
MQLVTAPTLDQILAAARRRAAGLAGRRRALERAAAAAPAPRPLGPPAGGAVGVIAEVKRRSPSAGEIRADLDAAAYGRAYAAGGAGAISVLTDEAYFGGSLADLTAVARAAPLPVLRKDFLVDELQLLEARAAGASVVLLIVRALEPGTLRALALAARGLGLSTLIEVHTPAELDLALSAGPSAVGVNSRDLATYAIDLAAAERLVAAVPGGVVAVAESGVETRADVERLAAAGADYVLVGTSLVRSPEPAAAVRALVGVPRRVRGTAGQGGSVRHA